MAKKKESRREELGRYAMNGELRAMLERNARLTPSAIDLAVDVVIRYCEPRRNRRRATQGA